MKNMGIPDRVIRLIVAAAIAAAYALGYVSGSLAIVAWKAQVRLCARFRRLVIAGKKQAVVVAAIAREVAAFLWAIGGQVAPAI